MSSSPRYKIVQAPSTCAMFNWPCDGKNANFLAVQKSERVWFHLELGGLKPELSPAQRLQTIKWPAGYFRTCGRFWWTKLTRRFCAGEILPTLSVFIISVISITFNLFVPQCCDTSVTSGYYTLTSRFTRLVQEVKLFVLLLAWKRDTRNN